MVIIEWKRIGIVSLSQTVNDRDHLYIVSISVAIEIQITISNTTKSKKIDNSFNIDNYTLGFLVVFSSCILLI